MKSFFLLCLFFSFLAYSEPLISSIQVQTLNPELKTSLESTLRTYNNKTANAQTLNLITKTIVRNLIRQKYRNSILRGPFINEESQNQAHLLVEIVNPYRYEFIFKNNQKINRRILFQALQTNTLSSQINFAQTTQEKLEDYYHSKGFNDIRIQHQILKEDKNFARKIIFTINEGIRFKIRNLKFTGSYSQKESFYRKLFFSYASPELKSRYYVKKDFDQTLRRMISHLRRNGFLNSEIMYTNVQKNENNFDIEVFLKEDRPLMIQKINIQGNKFFSTDEIKEIVGVREENILNLDEWEIGLERLVIQYYNKGYLDFKILNRKNLLSIQKSLQTAHISLQLQEGQKTLIEDIQIKGHQKVHPSFIIHASGLKPGTFITQKDLIRAQDFINDLQMFSNVQVYHQTLNQKTNVIIEVKERLFRFLRFRFGGNLKASQVPIEYVEKRFLGHDESELNLKSRLIGNYEWVYPAFMDSLQSSEPLLQTLWNRQLFEYDFSAGYKHHYLMKSYFNLITSYSRINSIFTLPEGPNRSSGWLRSDRFMMSLERKFSLETILTFKLLELEFNESRTIENFQDILDRNSQILSLSGFSFYMDRRNNLFYPTSGQFFLSRLDYSGPLLRTDPNIHFLRFESHYSFYVPLFSNDIIWAQSIHGGYAHTFEQIPVTYMFVLGGPQSLRGYNEEVSGDLLAEQYNIEIENANSTFNQSSFYLLTKSEIRFPIYRELKGALFYDGGSVYLMNGQTPELRSYLHSVGLSLHYSLLVMNIGFKLKPIPYADEFRFENREQLFVQFEIGSF